ncbi:MAG: hypothetical protein ACFFBC_08515 [Promethearchaeota archaeon]
MTAEGLENLTPSNCLDEDPYDKIIKMKYGQQIKALKTRNFKIEKFYGKQKKFGLTPEGKILGLILTYFG